MWLDGIPKDCTKHPLDFIEEAQALRDAVAEVNKHIARLALMGYDVSVDYHTKTHIVKSRLILLIRFGKRRNCETSQEKGV